MHMVNSLSVKEYATKITKRGTVNNPEASLRLENQISSTSVAAVA
jgi:hypothetical protein